MPSAKWNATPILYVNPITGSDENTGDSAHPLKTEGEFNRRRGVYPGTDGLRAKYATRARQFTGITDQTLHCLNFRDYASSGEYQFAGISGGTATANVGASGVLRIVSGTSGQGGTISYPGLGGNNQAYSASSMSGKRWYLVWCWRIQSATPNSDTRFYGMVGPGTMATSAAVGFNGRAQTTKYAFSAIAADVATTSPALNVVSTISPVVGRWDVGELFYDGRYVYGCVNDEYPVTVANANVLPITQMITPQFECRPAASGQADPIDIEFDGMWVEQ